MNLECWTYWFGPQMNLAWVKKPAAIQQGTYPAWVTSAVATAPSERSPNTKEMRCAVPSHALAGARPQPCPAAPVPADGLLQGGGLLPSSTATPCLAFHQSPPPDSKLEQAHLHASEPNRPIQAGFNSLWPFGYGGIKTELFLDSLPRGLGAAFAVTEVQSLSCCSFP